MNLKNVKKIIIIAGPNGAGKTTFACEFLPTDEACLHFVNADLIAAGLSPFAPEAAALQAGRLMLTQISARVAQRVRQGGHNIAEAVIRRRFVAGLANLPRYCDLVDDWDVYDNSGTKPVLINERTL